MPLLARHIYCEQLSELAYLPHGMKNSITGKVAVYQGVSAKEPNSHAAGQDCY